MAETTAPAQVTSVTIIGRRWFQRGPGNTYCTAQVLINGRPAFTTEKEYGYGDYYVQGAFEQMEKRGLIPPLLHYSNGSQEAYWQWAERNGIELYYSATDVTRERDL